MVRLEWKVETLKLVGTNSCIIPQIKPNGHAMMFISLLLDNTPMIMNGTHLACFDIRLEMRMMMY